MSENPGTRRAPKAPTPAGPAVLDGRAARHLADHVPAATRLIDTSARLFHEHSYAETTTRQIAEALGLKKASLYHHMGSKEDLLMRICSEAVTRLRTDVEAAIESAAPEEQLDTAIRAHVVSALRNRDLHAVMQLESRHLSDERHEELEALRRDYQRVLHTIVRRDQREARLRKDVKLKHLMLSLMTTLNWSTAAYDGADKLTYEDFGELVARLYLTGAAGHDA